MIIIDILGDGEDCISTSTGSAAEQSPKISINYLELPLQIVEQESEKKAEIAWWIIISGL